MKNTHRAYEFFITSVRLSFSKVAQRIPSQVKKRTFYLLGFFSVIESPLLSLPLSEISTKTCNAGPAGVAQCLSVDL